MPLLFPKKPLELDSIFLFAVVSCNRPKEDTAPHNMAGQMVWRHRLTRRPQKSYKKD